MQQAGVIPQKQQVSGIADAFDGLGEGERTPQEQDKVLNVRPGDRLRDEFMDTIYQSSGDLKPPNTGDGSMATHQSRPTRIGSHQKFHPTAATVA